MKVIIVFFLQEVGLDKRPLSKTCVAAMERMVLFDLSCLNDIYILDDNKVVLVYWNAMSCHIKCVGDTFLPIWCMPT